MMRIRKRRIVAAGGCFCLAALFLWMASVLGNKAESYFRNISIRAETRGFDTEWINSAIKQQEITKVGEGESELEDKETFAVWTELKNESISAMEGGKNSVTNVIAVYGPSHCLLPLGKNLLPEDKEGCIIGVELAEELFGTHLAEGQQLEWAGKTMTVRGVLREPEHFLMVEASGLRDAITFDRINISLSDSQDRIVAGERFINRHGLAAQELQWNHRYGWKWLSEMVPAKWSDFEGWRENFQKHKKAVEFVKNTEKSAIESEGIKYYEQRLLFELLGILFCGLWVRNIWYIIRKVSIL